MDPGVRGPRWHQLTLLGRPSSRLELVDLLLQRLGWEWRWKGGTRLAHLDLLLRTGGASPDPPKQ
jgi:hypothetical protein